MSLLRDGWRIRVHSRLRRQALVVASRRKAAHERVDDGNGALAFGEFRFAGELRAPEDPNGFPSRDYGHALRPISSKRVDRIVSYRPPHTGARSSRSIASRMTPFICPRDGRATLRPNFPCWFTKWCTIYRTAPAPSSRASRNRKQWPMQRKNAGSACTGTICWPTLRSMPSLCSPAHAASIDEKRHLHRGPAAEGAPQGAEGVLRLRRSRLVRAAHIACELPRLERHKTATAGDGRNVSDREHPDDHRRREYFPTTRLGAGRDDGSRMGQWRNPCVPRRADRRYPLYVEHAFDLLDRGRHRRDRKAVLVSALCHEGSGLRPLLDRARSRRQMQRTGPYRSTFRCSVNVTAT